MAHVGLLSKEVRKTVGAGILSWKSDTTLRSTLVSHRASGLFDLFDEVTILFQEVREKDIALADEFGVSWIGSETNRNIGGGFYTLIRNSKTDYFLQLEDDLTICGPIERFARTLTEAISLIEAGRFDAFLCRRDDMLKAGYTKYFDIERYDAEVNDGFAPEFKRSTALTRAYHRLFRRKQAVRLLQKAVWLEKEPEKVFPKTFTRIETDNGVFFSTSGDTIRWGNPALFAPKAFFETFYSFAAANEPDYLSFGLSLEDLMNRVYRSWWKKQNVRLGFTKDVLIHHDRKDDGGKLNRKS